MKRFNLYSEIYFKPTKKGLEILPIFYENKKCKNGYLKMELWRFIEYFGEYFKYFGADGYDCPVYTDLYIDDEQLLDTTIEQDIRRKKLKRIGGKTFIYRKNFNI